MVDNQHKKITGYRDLTEKEIALMNEAKELAKQVGDLCSRLATSDVVDTQEGIDQRWLSIAKTDLQKGFMSLVRSIAQPTTF